MKEMEKEEVIRWWGIFNKSPWRMFIHIDKPTLSNGKTVNGLIHARIEGDRFYPITGIDEVDALKIVNADKYHCDVN